jgi:glycine betaine/proline transport system substrate-binding protein
MTHPTKSSLQGIALGLSMMFASSASIASEQVAIAEFKYPSAEAKVHVIKVLLEQRLGLKVSRSTGDHATFYSAMDRGKGDIDIHPEIWLPNQGDFKRQYVDQKGTVALSTKGYPVQQAFCVPRYFSEKYNVKSVFDLARPDVAKALDTRGKGKGEIWIGAPGWASASENHVKARDYGLLTFNDVVRSDVAVNLAALADAIKKKQGYAFYCMKPDQVWLQYDLVALQEPPHNPSCHKMVPASQDPDWFNKSKVTCDGETRTIRVGWSKSLEKRLPAVTSLLAKIEFDPESVTAMAYEIGVKKRDADEVAKEWVAANKKRVDGWFGM